MKRVASRSMAIASLLLASSGVSAKDKPAPHLYGAEPSWAEFQRLAEAAVSERLLDPESARFSWSSGIGKVEMRAELFQPKVASYWACGHVNARNRMGGYSGGGAFLVAIDYGRVLALSLDTNANGATGSNDIACKNLLARGVLPPPPAAVALASSDATSAPVTRTLAAPSPLNDIGLRLLAMPDGAYVASVAPGSIAANAQLRPGMVIASINGVPLAGMGDAMVKVIGAADSGSTLTIIGGTTIKLGGGK